jgi:hypothetical protein
MSSVGLRSPRSILLTIVWETPARSATAFMDSPNAIRFSESKRIDSRTTASGLPSATAKGYPRRHLTGYVPIGTVKHVRTPPCPRRRGSPLPKHLRLSGSLGVGEWRFCRDWNGHYEPCGEATAGGGMRAPRTNRAGASGTPHCRKG